MKTSWAGADDEARSPEITADAADTILERHVDERSGNTFLDVNVLRDLGVADKVCAEGFVDLVVDTQDRTGLTQTTRSHIEESSIGDSLHVWTRTCSRSAPSLEVFGRGRMSGRSRSRVSDPAREALDRLPRCLEGVHPR